MFRLQRMKTRHLLSTTSKIELSSVNYMYVFFVMALGKQNASHPPRYDLKTPAAKSAASPESPFSPLRAVKQTPEDAEGKAIEKTKAPASKEN